MKMLIIFLSMLVLTAGVPVDKEVIEELEDDSIDSEDSSADPESRVAESQSELRDDGDGLTGPEPSIVGSVDKVFKQVNNFDQYQCLQVSVEKYYKCDYKNYFLLENDLSVHGSCW